MNALMNKGYSYPEASQILSVITYPSKHTPLFMSILDLLTLGARIQKKIVSSSQQTTELKKWLTTYRHIPVNFCDEPWTLQDAQQQLREVLQKNCAEELQCHKQNHEQKLIEAKKLFLELNDPEILRLAHMLQFATWYNEYRKQTFSQVSLEIRKVFEALARRGKFSTWRDCFYFTSEELGQLLLGKLKNPKRLIKKREMVAMYRSEKGINILSLDDTNKLYSFIMQKKNESDGEGKHISEVKGLSAQKGIIRGVVKIVLGSSDFHKVMPGDILVTTMTSVDFVPVMAKAAAFVTNEGGIICHAAIVSREMKKPCIIGTKNATKTFKDGDYVEVNGDTGIVKKILRT